MDHGLGILYRFRNIYFMKKKGWGTTFMKEQVRKATFYKTMKKKMLYVIHAIYHISNKFLDFF